MMDNFRIIFENFDILDNRLPNNKIEISVLINLIFKEGRQILRINFIPLFPVSLVLCKLFYKYKKYFTYLYIQCKFCFSKYH